ncbi:hypothetical protein M758_UG114000 [Ceratodon purpureus]|nr:hypothetical protein M758_UG114000 [Ceratodon purpureus]
MACPGCTHQQFSVGSYLILHHFLVVFFCTESQLRPRLHSRRRKQYKSGSSKGRKTHLHSRRLKICEEKRERRQTHLKSQGASTEGSEPGGGWLGAHRIQPFIAGLPYEGQLVGTRKNYYKFQYISESEILVSTRTINRSVPRQPERHCSPVQKCIPIGFIRASILPLRSNARDTWMDVIERVSCDK